MSPRRSMDLHIFCRFIYDILWGYDCPAKRRRRRRRRKRGGVRSDMKKRKKYMLKTLEIGFSADYDPIGL
jgi:hypothetical protein